MCGIFGQYTQRGADPALIERMAQRLAHRGPDGYGTYHQGPLAFGAGRLAIIDLAAPAGPIWNEDRSAAVVFNGEIYNYLDLRAELQDLGHSFSTRTDTEVIVHGYEAWGADVIGRLRGMFALCVWDSVQQRLLLARDRLGEKPLYYTQREGEFLFASEIKALLEHPGVPRAVDSEALIQYLVLGYVTPPRTLFKGIYKFAPGQLMIVNREGDIHTERYWQPVMDMDQPLEGDYASIVQQVRAALTQAVEQRMMSDVPIGVFLSGGVDSTSVAAIVSRALDHPVQSFTVGFGVDQGSPKFDVDARFAKVASRHLGTEHHTITVRTQPWLSELLPHLIYALDEPIAEPAIIQTVHVSALARLSGVPVLLSGDAGDELFGGYPAYRADRKLERYLQVPGLLRRSILNPVFERMPARLDGLRKLAHKSRHTDPTTRFLEWQRIVYPARLPDLLADEALALRAGELVGDVLRPVLAAPTTRYFADRMAYTGLSLWVAEDSNMRVDKMSMAMSIESRAPFEDHLLADLAFRIPLPYKLRRGGFKTVLKDAVADLVPPEILNRPKWGFTPPTSDWLRGVFKPLVNTYLSPEYVASAGVFRPETITRLIDDHQARRSYELWPLWTALAFHIWHGLYIDGCLTLDSRLAPEDLFAHSGAG